MARKLVRLGQKRAWRAGWSGPHGGSRAGWSDIELRALSLSGIRLFEFEIRPLGGESALLRHESALPRQKKARPGVFQAGRLSWCSSLVGYPARVATTVKKTAMVHAMKSIAPMKL